MRVDFSACPALLARIVGTKPVSCSGLCSGRFRPNRVKGVLALLFLSLCIAACSAPPPGNAENGRRWFGLYRCDGCHGADGTGGKAPEIANLRLHYSTFLRKLRNSRSSVMPSFSKEKLSDQDAADIYQWLRGEPAD